DYYCSSYAGNNIALF
nr:immunoglobulin light chain junction region [Macaca mulatta]